MARKVFMSVLGSTNYRECCYTDNSTGFKSELTKFIQAAMFGKFVNKWGPDDIAYIFLTTGEKGSEVKNWLADGHCLFDSKEKIQSKGLRTLLESMNSSCRIEPVHIKNGDNETEIWSNFRTIFDCLQADDEVYFDVTHGFRSLPMLVLVLNNYSKFLKGISVKSITYGNYEARNDKNEAPIINLTSLTNLQDWTSAANMFIETGKTSGITELINDKEFSVLDEFVKEIAECRGLSIFSGATALKVQEELSAIHFQDHSFRELLNKVNEKVTSFGNSDLMNGFRAVEFCIQHKLIQQGITLLQEFIVSFILKEIYCEDWIAEINRSIASGCMSINSIESFKASEKLTDDEKQKARELAQRIFQLPYKKKLSDKVFKNLSLGARNDLNHAGMRIDPKETGYFEDRLFKYFELTKEILQINLYS